MRYRLRHAGTKKTVKGNLSELKLLWATNIMFILEAQTKKRGTWKFSKRTPESWFDLFAKYQLQKAALDRIEASIRWAQLRKDKLEFVSGPTAV